MPTYRYYIQGQEFTPINSGDYTHDYNLEEESGFYQFVYSLSGSIAFGADAYSFVEKHSDCQKLTLVITERSNIGEFELFNGYFTNRDCSFSPSEKRIEITAIEDSIYTCIKKNIDVKFNFLQLRNIVTADYVPDPLLEWKITPQGAAGVNPELPFGWGLPVVDDMGDDPFIVWFIYARQTETVYCLGSEPQPPEGTGWVLIEDNCEINGTSRWGRKPPFIDGAPAGAYANTNCIAPCTPPLPNLVDSWILMGVVKLGNTNVGFWIKKEAYAKPLIEYNNGRGLVDVINYGLNEIGCAEVDVQSDFLTNPINPVTGQASKTNKIQLHSISDIKSPTADIKATIERTNLTDLFEGYLYGKLNCRLRADNNTKRLIIEHVSQFLGVITYDITEEQKGNRKYSFDNSDIPTAEEFPSLDSTIEFTGVDIRFINGCAKDVKAYNTERFYAEVESINNEPDIYPNDGIVMITPLSLAPPNDPDGYGDLSELGVITEEYKPNLPQAMSSLHERFWGYDRPFPIGIMNFETREFLDNRAVKDIESISVPLCKLGGSFFRFDPYAYFKGFDFDKGELISASYNEKTQEITLKIKYYE